MNHMTQSHSPDPIQLFREWYEEAGTAGHPMPDALSLSTVNSENRPSARMVLLKGVDERGFVFFTNYRSTKSEDLARNPFAAMVFYWQNIGRQVRIQGLVTRVSAEESDAYFESRPRDSQIGAWASNQSETIPNRAFLDTRFQECVNRYEDGRIPRPEHWGGFRLNPDAIEFWREGAHRLHDRILYERAETGSWSCRRLSP